MSLYFSILSQIWNIFYHGIEKEMAGKPELPDLSAKIIFVEFVLVDVRIQCV